MKGPKKKEGSGLGGIYNLSVVTLTRKETNILNLGPKCGMKKPINKFGVYIDIHKYIRKLNIKKYLLGSPLNVIQSNSNPSGVINSGLRNKRLFNPLNVPNHQVEVFKGLVLRDLDKLTPK